MTANKTARRQRGDTIVEVLICVLIVSTILAGAYVTTQKSSQGIRKAQEHAEALKLVQTQLEQVRANAADPVPQVFTPSATPFCMADGQFVNSGGAGDPKCVQDSTGQPTTEEPAYHVSVVHTTEALLSGDAEKFQVTVTWSQTSGSQGSEQMTYRLRK